MKTRSLLLFCVLLLLGTPTITSAATLPDGTPSVVGGMESTPESRKRIAERREAMSKRKLVDINGASLKQLKKLPGIGDAEAKRIIAGRPYGSKAWLVTKGIIGQGPYNDIKLIVAKQPYTDLNKNAAIYQDKAPK